MLNRILLVSAFVLTSGFPALAVTPAPEPEPQPTSRAFRYHRYQRQPRIAVRPQHPRFRFERRSLAPRMYRFSGPRYRRHRVERI